MNSAIDGRTQLIQLQKTRGRGHVPQWAYIPPLHLLFGWSPDVAETIGETPVRDLQRVCLVDNSKHNLDDLRDFGRLALHKRQPHMPLTLEFFSSTGIWRRAWIGGDEQRSVMANAEEHILDRQRLSVLSYAQCERPSVTLMSMRKKRSAEFTAKMMELDACEFPTAAALRKKRRALISQGGQENLLSRGQLLFQEFVDARKQKAYEAELSRLADPSARPSHFDEVRLSLMRGPYRPRRDTSADASVVEQAAICAIAAQRAGEIGFSKSTVPIVTLDRYGITVHPLSK